MRKILYACAAIGMRQSPSSTTILFIAAIIAIVMAYAVNICLKQLLAHVGNLHLIDHVFTLRKSAVLNLVACRQPFFLSVSYEFYTMALTLNVQN